MRFDLAGPKDEPAIQRLLRRTPLAGGIRLSLERQPSAFVANAVGSEQIQILVGRGPVNGEVAAMGVRGVMDWYLNGVPGRVGYLGQLRVDPCYRARPRLLAQGYAKLRELHEADGTTPIYATTITTDNVAARRILEAGIEGMPSYRHIDDLVTFVIATHAESRRRRCGVDIADADPGDLQEIVQCLARYGARHQFNPVWSHRVLLNGDRTRDLGVDDFVVARGHGGVVGCLALWDQRKFKQTVVRGYSLQLACARPAANVLSRLTGSPRLPRVGEQLDMAYVSHVAVGDGDPQILEALLRRALGRAAERRIALVALGFSRRNVLAQVVARGFRAREYRSHIYVAFWPDGAGAADAIEDLPCHLEVAIL
jgi:hypothetical protein